MSNLRFISFSSGSCGNCYYLGVEDGPGLLIDAGVSLRRLKQHLQAVGLDYDAFDAVLVTHDHLDHIRHLGSFCKKLCKPVHASAMLHRALTHHSFTRTHITGCRRDLEEGVWNTVGAFSVRYFIVPHDASQTCGFAIRYGERLFVIMTDVGRMTEEALEWAGQADTVVIESNYDVDMLLGGPYPHELKMRICQGNGHLSNGECADAIRRFWHPGLRNLFLCHLSENNNTPEKAYACARQVLSDLGVPEGAVNLRTLPRMHPSPLINL